VFLFDDSGVVEISKEYSEKEVGAVYCSLLF
jgi:hypothetical protein